MIYIHADSHADHGVQLAHIQWVIKYKNPHSLFDGKGVFAETFDIPKDLPPIPCGLYGPIMGDKPIKDSEVFMIVRGNRKGPSRLINKPKRPSRMLSIICGLHDGNLCVLYTAFGGPLAPSEPWDSLEKDVELSKEFWAVHALAADEEAL